MGIRYKAIYQGRQIPKVEGKKQIQVFYIKLNISNFKSNFNNLVMIYRRKVLGFEDGRKMRVSPYPELVKSDGVWGTLVKAYEGKKIFLEAIMQDYTSSFLYIDTILLGVLLFTIRIMLLSIKSK